MKPLFILLASFFSVFSKAEALPFDDVTPVVLKSFTSTFSKAKEVDWTESGRMYKARFTLDGQYINAFYSEDGDLLALTRNVSTSQLPVLLQAELKKQTDKYWITELFEITNEEGTSYFVSLENADTKIVMKSAGNKSWQSYSKLRKI
jgi:hypothetical protein